MSNELTTITGDELYAKLGDARYDAMAKAFGYDGDNPPAPDAQWVVETDDEGNITAVVEEA